jgi:hypothetical protein
VIRWKVYIPGIDGNVFSWILKAAQERRELKAREKDDAIKKASTKSESLDRPKMDNP